MEILSSVADELQFKLTQIENTVKLFDEGATVPFIARYRKEVTGNLDEEQIRDVIEKVTYYRNLEKRKEEDESGCGEGARIGAFIDICVIAKNDVGSTSGRG